MDCPMCGRSAPDDATECPSCTATIRFEHIPAPPRSDPSVGPQEPMDKIRVLDAQERQKLESRPWWDPYRGPAMVGIIAWFMTIFVGGFPASIDGARFFMILMASVLFGAPLGALTKLVGGGWIRGAGVSVVLFILQNSLIPGLLCGGWAGIVTTLWVCVAVFPGIMVGVHIDLSRT